MNIDQDDLLHALMILLGRRITRTLTDLEIKSLAYDILITVNNNHRGKEE